MKQERKFWLCIVISIVVSLVAIAIFWGVSIHKTEREIKELDASLEQIEMVYSIRAFSESKGKLQCIKSLYLSGSITESQAKTEATYVVRNVEEGFQEKVEQAYEQHIKNYPEMDGNIEVFINTSINELEELIKQTANF